MKPILILFFLVTTVFSQSESDDIKTHEFDFWIGDWDVHKFGTDTLVGISSVKPILSHKTIEENYQSTQYGYMGKSLNTYNKKENQWEQYWVDNSGLRLQLSGGIRDGKMILSDCKTVNPCNRITWTGLTDGTVRQEWEQSKDDGKTWEKVFDGHYKMKLKNSDTVEPALTMISKYPKVRDFTISTSGKEAYFTIQSPLEELSVIARVKMENDIWLEPEISVFSGKYKDLEPFLSPDNKRIYFASNRPLDQSSTQIKDFDIWHAERKDLDSDWSEPIPMGSPINTGYDEFYPAVANNGNVYFTRNSPDSKGEDDIFMSTWENNIYKTPISLSKSINTEGYEFNSYIAPDESFIIYSGYNRKDGFGSGDLYISYRNELGNWGEAQNLGGEINSKYMDYCPFVHLDSKTLYFTSTRSAINPEEFKSIRELEANLNRYENGLSKVYKVSIPKKLH